MEPRFAVPLVLGIFLINALVWIPIILWMRRKTAAHLAMMRDQIAATGERLVLGPDSMLFRGATRKNAGIANNGLIALTDRRLLLRPLVGKAIELPLHGMVSVREAKVFRTAVRPGRMHVVITLRDGEEIGFIVSDHAGWMRALARLAVE